jgi:hypothetical protein
MVFRRANVPIIDKQAEDRTSPGLIRRRPNSYERVQSKPQVKMHYVRKDDAKRTDL